MAEYIERRVLLEAFANADHPIQYPDGSHGLGLGYAGFREMLLNLPAADVVERKRGKWISHLLDDGSFWANYCSECGVYLPYGLDWKPNGCPNCFADMRGET